MISISKVYIGPEEESAVLEVLRSGQLAQGPRVAALEAAFAEYHGAKHGIAVNNGTTALIAALMAHGIEEGDEVIVPSFSFFATASCVLSVGAIPVFADIDPKTYCISPEKLAECITERTAAVIAVHLFGRPADMDVIEGICRENGIELIEDAAQAHGASIHGRHVGTWGTAAFSFYSTKNMMCGEGGMILTDREDIADRLRMIRNQGMSRQYLHEVVGYNFRMSDLFAAIALEQLKRLPIWTERRIQNASFFDSVLDERILTPVKSEGVRHVYHQYTIRLPFGSESRSIFLKKLEERGVCARVYYPIPIHKQPVFLTRQYLGPDIVLRETELASEHVVSLPVHPHLSEDDLHVIADAVNWAIQRI